MSVNNKCEERSHSEIMGSCN